MANTSSINDEGEITPTEQLRASLVELNEVLGEVVGGLEPAEVQLPVVTEIWRLFGHLRRLAESGEVLLAVRVREAGVTAERANLRVYLVRNTTVKGAEQYLT